MLSPSTTLTRNTADDNAAFGIEVIPEAIPGLIDGRHNEASGNGNLTQCIGG